MPYSNIEQITPIMQEVNRIRPQRMLDVGCGLGIYGMLSRVQLDLYFDEKFYTKIYRKYRAAKRWPGVTIDAIEGFSDYLDYIPDWVYDNVVVEDAMTALPKIASGHYDLTLALAIIEHLEKEQGIAFVNHLRRISKSVIISVPKNVLPQEGLDNPFETHRSNWSEDDFVALGATRFLPHQYVWIAVFDESSAPPFEIHDPMTNSDSDARAEAVDPLQVEAMFKRLLEGQEQIIGALSIKRRLGVYWSNLRGH
ncbi:MAG: hypothetical protein EOM91_12415 [Sphingobacteriia bacterium]|nr:hypothetical protein [Sphingobacteriia bacterium]NCC39182.1 hypothetical protein [Gammaproteobacteria bacterium]